ncbi:MAG: helix-turn-helix domain-containing protein, partial [Erysipelotrichaceae bacterium]|nr:helix-turn-helix domain-containing protein [Erysipelotrichaceae bacterium]
MQKLADAFYISKSTLSADLKYYREICNSAKGLQLITNKSGGLSLEGNETAMRYLFRVIFYMFLPSDKEYIKRCAFRYFGSASLATQIRDILMHSLPEQGIILNDDSLTALTFQIMVSSYRYNRGNHIEPSGKTEKP